jgi:hypothetical protein
MCRRAMWTIHTHMVVVAGYLDARGARPVAESLQQTADSSSWLRRVEVGPVGSAAGVCGAAWRSRSQVYPRGKC